MKKDEAVELESPKADEKPTRDISAAPPRISRADIMKNIKAQVDDNLREIDSENMTIDEKFEQTKVLYTSTTSKRFDVIFVVVALALLAFVWIFVYKQPIPFGVRRILGMDSPLYQEDLDAMKRNEK